MIYIADSDWNPTKSNPFTAKGLYDENWSAFLYDSDVSYFTNVYPGANLHVIRFSSDADKNYIRLFDFLNYELSYQRNVILKVNIGMKAEDIIELFNKTPHQVRYRSSDENYMVHSTTLSAWESIKQDGALLSPNLLKENNRAVNEIGLKPMNEPKDYSDYIMLDVLDGCGELVVNSHNIGSVCIDPNTIYTPGVRLYFDVRKMFADEVVTRDGLHPVKVKDRLPLRDYLLAAITANDFASNIKWTPSLFTQKANEFFHLKYIRGAY